MQANLSKTLETLVSRLAFDAEKNKISTHLTDRLIVRALTNADSHLSMLLAATLKDWELYQIKIRIEREIDSRNTVEVARGEYFETLRSDLANVCGFGRTATTAHLLLLSLTDRTLISFRVMEMYNITRAVIEERMLSLPPDEDVVNIKFNILPSNIEPTPTAKQRLLDKFGVNLTTAASQGTIDPVIGRSKEIQRLIQILGRRKKNNPILIGEAGVGKSAIVEGLALKIIAGEVPSTLRDKQVYSLDITSLVAGTKYRGEFEERMRELIDELKRSSDVIVFIDEIHTIVGAGSTQGSLDTANMLKPALARGELQCIGATTLNEYRENIERDAALERRFQKIIVEPATPEETMQILRNIAPRYEAHHEVRYTDESLRICVELAQRYITDRCFPDKAIDVLDEAGSKAHLASIGEPTQLRSLEQALAQSRDEKNRAAQQADYTTAAEAGLREMALTARIEESRREWQQQVRNNTPEITAEHIESVITSMTGIPVERVSQSERNRLGTMREYLDGLVVGQSEAVEKVTRSIIRSRAGLKDPGKPIGVFMFVGPTGVGKTLLAKELARRLFDRDEAIIRIDMSEYSERHNVSRLIGSPPGYVGYGEGGQLTEAVRRQPYAVVLFDEIEKAHSDVFNTMLQIFDEGQLTDGLGRKVDFKNTVIIMTSNVGSRAISTRGASVGYFTSDSESNRLASDEAEYRKALTATFAPEFINRIDDIVIFNTLRDSDIESIVRLETALLCSRASKLGYTIELSREAIAHLARCGYDSQYGVRSLKRAILDRLEAPLAQMIVAGKLASGDTVDVSCTDGNISLLVKAA